MRLPAIARPVRVVQRPRRHDPGARDPARAGRRGRGRRPLHERPAKLQGHVRPGQLVCRRRGCRERRADGGRRDPHHRRRGLEDPVQRPGRARDRVAQAASCCTPSRRRSAATMKVELVGGRQGARRVEGRDRPASMPASSSWASSPRTRRRSSARSSSSRAPTAALRRGAAHAGRPAGARAGLVRHRPARVAGRRRRRASPRASWPRCTGWVAAGGRLVIVGRHRRQPTAGRVPRRAAALPPDHDAGHRPRRRSRPSWAAPGRRHAADRSRGLTRARAPAGPVGRPRDRGRSPGRQRHGHAHRLRPDHQLDRGRRAVGHAALAAPPAGHASRGDHTPCR